MHYRNHPPSPQASQDLCINKKIKKLKKYKKRKFDFLDSTSLDFMYGDD